MCIRDSLHTWSVERASAQQSRRPHKLGGEPLPPATENGRRAVDARSGTASAWPALPSPWWWG
eukprot:8511303-Alexandrium_andersonii.AAC.1